MKTKSQSTREREGRQATFLAHLMQGASVKDAAQAAGIHRRTAYDWKDQSKSFSNEWDDAVQSRNEELLVKYESELHTRALDRTDKNSYILLMFLIKKLEPAYRENFKSEHKVIHESVKEITFSNEEMDKAIDILTSAKSPQEKDL